MTRSGQLTAARHRALVTGLAAAVAGVLAGGYVAASALAAPSGPRPVVPAPSAAADPAGGQQAEFTGQRLPAPVIVQHPRNPTRSRTALFEFRDAAWPDVTFFCHLDSRPVRICTFDEHETFGMDDGVLLRDQPEGRAVYFHLRPGVHCFHVHVSDDEGSPSAITRFCWRVLGHRRRPHLKNFAVGGNLTTPLYPRVSEPLDMTFTNPNAKPITVPAGGITKANITVTASKAGCGPSNFAVTRGLTVNVTIPAHRTTPVSLSALHIPATDWPVITMLNTAANQDVCEGATLTLKYAGIEARS